MCDILSQIETNFQEGTTFVRKRNSIRDFIKIKKKKELLISMKVIL